MTTEKPEATKDYTYFGIQSSWGITKHLGGRKATDRLVELCGITSASKVLEIGCGVGITSCYLAKKAGCALTSIDLNEQMIAWSKKRAEQEGLADRITFRPADAQELPFEDATFDAVISESVTAFTKDKPRAISEYKRVLKPRGYVGLTEASWVKSPPPAELVEFLSVSMEGAAFLKPDAWLALLEEGGFADLHGEVTRLTVMSQFASDLGGQSWRDIGDRFRAMGAFIGQYFKDPEMRRYAKKLMPSRRTMKDLFTYFGYGIYTGKKPA